VSDLSALSVLLPGGAGAIVTLIVLLILNGRLVARSVLEDVRKDRDDRIAELIKDRDMWRAAHRESEAARIEATSQVGELLELARVADHVLRAIRREVPGDAMDPTVAAPPS
jgi:F0F1-type ATP synthase membrane subunit b/b'